MIQFHQFWDVYLETWGSCLTKQWLHDPIVDVINIWTKLIMSSRRDVAIGMMGIGFGESPPFMAAGWSYFQATVVNDYQSYCQLFSQIDRILRSGCQQSNTPYFEHCSGWIMMGLWQFQEGKCRHPPAIKHGKLANLPFYDLPTENGDLPLLT